MRQTDEVNTEERRMQIVQAAVNCFNRSGLHNATINQICKEAGVSPGHLYYYFESKESLIQAVFNNDWDIANNYFDEFIDEPNAIPIYLGLTTSKAHVLPEDRIANQAVVTEVVAEIGRNPALAKINKSHRKKYLKKLTKMVSAAQLRGELMPGTSIDEVVFAIDTVATARMVSNAANRFDPAAYAKHTRSLLKGLVVIPDER